MHRFSRKPERGLSVKAYFHFHLTQSLPREESVSCGCNTLKHYYQNWKIHVQVDLRASILRDRDHGKIQVRRGLGRAVVQLLAQRRVSSGSSGFYPVWFWKPQCTDGDCTTASEKRRLKQLASFLPIHELVPQIPAVLQLSRKDIPIHSRVLIFLLMQTSMHLDELTQVGNSMFTGGRTHGQQQHTTLNPICQALACDC